MLTALIAWIVVGLIAGALLKWIMPETDPAGIGATILIGLVGSLIGGFIMSVLLGIGEGDSSGRLS